MRNYRHALTLPEILLWQRLKGSPCGVAFRKQHGLGPYRFDFYCAAAKVAVEVDGMAHDLGDRPARDAVRDAWARARGIETVRMAAADVLADADGVAEGVVRLCLARVG